MGIKKMSETEQGVAGVSLLVAAFDRIEDPNWMYSES
jgi:hypothetical protein